MTSTVTVNDAINLLKNGEAVLIDVREPDEFKAEHIAYALSLPLSNIEDGFKLLNLPDSKTILFQCLKGGRGQKACERIQGLGECKNKIVNIEGGLEAWKAEGFPVIGSNSTSKIPIIRQVQLIVGFLITICVVLGFLGLSVAFVLAGIFGAALFFAGLTGWCGLAMLLSHMPWNK